MSGRSSYICMASGCLGSANCHDECFLPLREKREHEIVFLACVCEFSGSFQLQKAMNFIGCNGSAKLFVLVTEFFGHTDTKHNCFIILELRNN